jgi:hypothetical protein
MLADAAGEFGACYRTGRGQCSMLALTVSQLTVLHCLPCVVSCCAPHNILIIVIRLSCVRRRRRQLRCVRATRTLSRCRSSWLLRVRRPAGCATATRTWTTCRRSCAAHCGTTWSSGIRQGSQFVCSWDRLLGCLQGTCRLQRTSMAAAHATVTVGY